MVKQICRVGVGIAVILGCARIAPAGFLGEYRYQVLLDTDRNTTTGCNVPVDDKNINTTVSGIDQKITITIMPAAPDTTGPSIVAVPWHVTHIYQQHCVGGTFVPADPGEVVSNGIWPVGDDDGVAGSDVIEGFVPRGDLGDPSTMRVVFTASNGGFGSDVLLSTNGLLDGPQIIFDLISRRAPALSAAGLALSVLLLSMVAWWALRRRTTPRHVLLLGAMIIAGAAVAWAATIQLDGNVADWAGIQPIAHDLSGDSNGGPGGTNDPGEDIIAAFMTADGTNIYFRIDVADLRSPT